MPPPSGNSFPLTYSVLIDNISIQNNGFTGSRGEGTYLKIKNGDDPIFVIFDWKYICINTYFSDVRVHL